MFVNKHYQATQTKFLQKRNPVGVNELHIAKKVSVNKNKHVSKNASEHATILQLSTSPHDTYH